MRAAPRERPETLTAPPDGTSLDEVIGDLQSTWGVPQYPQEYRLVLKVSETRDRSSSSSGNGEASEATAPTAEGSPKREKAPPPREMAGGPGGGRKKRRRKRRRRKNGGSGSGGSS